MEKTKIVSVSRFEIISENPYFTRVKCYVCAAGKNRNGSYISRESIEDAIPSAYGIPVVAHLYQDDEGKHHAHAHDCAIVENSNGELELKPITVPFGFVPERDTFRFEPVEEPNGRGIHDYLTCEVVLWTGRYPELTEAYLSDDKYFGQSMEIYVDESDVLQEDKNYTEIKKFTFDALTLLGDGVEPCFPEAKVVPFSRDDATFSQLLEEFKGEVATYDKNESGEEEGAAEVEATASEEIVEVADNPVEFVRVEVEGETPADVPPSVTTSTLSVEGGSTSRTFRYGESMNIDAILHVDETEGAKPVLPASFALYKNKKEALSLVFKEDFFESSDDGTTGRVGYQCLVDFDDNYVYVEYYEVVWDVNADPSERKVSTHYRIGYEYDEITNVATAVGDRVEVFMRYLSADDIRRLADRENEYTMLKAYKDAREEELKQAEYDSVLNEFSELSSIEAYQDIVERKMSYGTVDDLRDACYLVRGKYSVCKPTTKSDGEPFIGIVTKTPEKLSLREKLHNEYGK